MHLKTILNRVQNFKSFVYGPVRWVEVVLALKARGLTHVFECGPGKVLTSLVMRVHAELAAATLHDPATLRAAKEMVA